MGDRPAIPIETVHGHLLNEDKSRLLIQTDLPLMLSFHSSTLRSLVSAALAGMSAPSGSDSKSAMEKVVFATDWWEVGLSNGGQALVLSFGLGNGAEFSFHLHRDQAVHMRDALSVVVGDITAAAPTASIQ